MLETDRLICETCRNQICQLWFYIRSSTEKIGIPWKTKNRDVWCDFANCKVLQVNAVAMSGSMDKPKCPCWRVPRLWCGLHCGRILRSGMTLLGWKGLASASSSSITPFDHRRLYLMLFEDGNRILDLCPKEHIKEWVDSEADFTVLDDLQDCLLYAPTPKRYWTAPASADWLWQILQWPGCQLM